MKKAEPRERGTYLQIHEMSRRGARVIRVQVWKLDTNGDGIGYLLAGPRICPASAQLIRSIKLSAEDVDAIQECFSAPLPH